MKRILLLDEGYRFKFTDVMNVYNNIKKDRLIYKTLEDKLKFYLEAEMYRIENNLQEEYEDVIR